MQLVLGTTDGNSHSHVLFNFGRRDGIKSYFTSSFLWHPFSNTFAADSFFNWVTFINISLLFEFFKNQRFYVLIDFCVFLCLLYKYSQFNNFSLYMAPMTNQEENNNQETLKFRYVWPVNVSLKKVNSNEMTVLNISPKFATVFDHVSFQWTVKLHGTQNLVFFTALHQV